MRDFQTRRRERRCGGRREAETKDPNNTRGAERERDLASDEQEMEGTGEQGPGPALMAAWPWHVKSFTALVYPARLPVPLSLSAPECCVPGSSQLVTVLCTVRVRHCVVR
jgi:hypothetical protein